MVSLHSIIAPVIFIACFKHFGKYSIQYYLNHLLIILVCYHIAKFAGFSSMIASWGVIVLSAIAISWVMLVVEMKIAFMRKLCGLK